MVTTKSLFMIVLAAGTASRYGSVKQLAVHEGETLVGRATRLATTVCADKFVVVTGDHWQPVYDACSPMRGFFVRNEAFEEGIGTSISCGIRAVVESADAVLLTLADQPLISAAYLREMISVWRTSETKIVCSGYAGVTGPPAIFPSARFPDLLQLDGDKGARAIIEANREQLIVLPCDAAEFDVDVPADLDKLGP